MTQIQGLPQRRWLDDFGIACIHGFLQRRGLEDYGRSRDMSSIPSVSGVSSLLHLELIPRQEMWLVIPLM